MQPFRLVTYESLNPRQQEIVNFQKVSGVFADYGFATHRLTDDWNGADFLAVNFDGETFLRVQLKTRLSFAKKYLRQKLWVCFRHEGAVYEYPHDKFLGEVITLATSLNMRRFDQTMSWKEDGEYHYNTPPNWLLPHLMKYRLGLEIQPAR